MRLNGLLARIIGLILAAVLLQGCSAIKLVYNTSPEFGHWWIDGYVDLNDAQSQRVKDDLGRLQGWHRTTELPAYALLIEQAEKLAAADVTPDQACAVLNEGRARVARIMTQAEPMLVTLGMSMDTAQLRFLEKKYAKLNTEYRKEWLQPSPVDIQEKRFKRILERSEMIYGKLDDAQRDVIRKQLDQSIFDVQVAHIEQLRRQQDSFEVLRKLMRPDMTLSAGREVIKGYMERLLDSPNPAHRNYQHRLLLETCKSFSTAHNSTTAAQKETAVRRLRAYRRDALDLAAQK